MCLLQPALAKHAVKWTQRTPTWWMVTMTVRLVRDTFLTDLHGTQGAQRLITQTMHAWSGEGEAAGTSGAELLGHAVPSSGAGIGQASRMLHQTMRSLAPTA